MFSRIANMKMGHTFYAVPVCTCILFVFHGPFISCEGNESTTTPTRYDMIHYLLNRNDYDSNLPPGLKDTSVKPTDVHVQLSIYDLNSESDVNMEYECTMYMRVNWVDSRLNYAANNTNYTTLKLSSADVGKIWIPDLFFYHERHSEIHALLSENVLVYIYENGSVQYSVRVNTRFHCEMDLTKYPFYIQECPVIIQSYAYTAEYMILHWLGDPPVIIDNADHLKLKNGSTKSGFWLPYNALAGNYSTLNATILYNRSSESLDIMYMAPTIVLVGVSMSSFFFGDQLSSRIAVVTGSLTQIILQWAGVYGKLPPVSSLSRLDLWMLCNLVFVGFVLIANAVIYHTVIKTNKAEQEKSKQDSDEKKENDHLDRLTLICKIMLATGNHPEESLSDADWSKIESLKYSEINNRGGQVTDFHAHCRKHINAIAFVCSALVYMVFVLVFIFGLWKK